MNHILELSPHEPTDFLVDHRKPIIFLVLLLSTFLGAYVHRVTFDSSLRAFYESASPEYTQYHRFLKIFGNDELLLAAIKYDAIDQAQLIDSLDTVTKKLGMLKQIAESISLTNVALFRERGGTFGPRRLVINENGLMKLPSKSELDDYRKALPFLNLLVSSDCKTFGILLKMNETWRFKPDTAVLLKKIRTVISQNIPTDTEFRVIGAPILRMAFVKYNSQSAVIFGLLGCLIGGLAAIYIFRSFRFGLLVTTIVGLCIVWLLGLMGLLGITINTATTITFGIIPIVGTATLIHIITHYNSICQEVMDPTRALKKALGIVARPCFMCAVTTSVGFGSLMVSHIPMVRQVGMILSLAVMSTFILSMTVAPAMLLLLKPVRRDIYERISHDYVSSLQRRVLDLVFSRYKWCMLIFLVVIVFMFGSVPWIRIGIEPLEHFRKNTPEMQDGLFVRKNLSTIRCVEVIIESHPGTFRRPNAWREVAILESQLRQLPGVLRTESLLSLMQYLCKQVAQPNTQGQDLFTNPCMIPQLLAITSLSPGGRKLLSKHLDDQRKMCRITVWLHDSSSTSLDKSIADIRRILDQWKPSDVKSTWITGILAVYSAQVSDLLTSQVISLIIALSVITMLMIIQLRSFTLGLLSLIPNILPIACIFGLMAWLDISLNSMTVFAATAAIGLAVDDTIHYLTQLRREMFSPKGEHNVEKSLYKAYETTARALISTSVVLCFGFLTLLLSPFRPLASFGILLSSGILFALIGDLVVMPAIILTFPYVRRTLEEQMMRHSS